MLIAALVLAVVGLASLVGAVLSGNELLAWVCIAASAVGVLLLVADAIRERQNRRLQAAEAGAVAGGTEAETAVITESAAETAVIGDPVAETDVLKAAEDAAAAEDADVAAEIATEMAVEDHPEEVVHDEPEYDTFSDDEPDFPAAAEEAAMHTVQDESAEADESADADEAADDVVDGKR